MKFANQLGIDKRQPKAFNRAGGRAHKESLKLELVSMLLTSMLKDHYYESANGSVTRLAKLVNDIGDKKFVAKAALFARKEAGMRSVSHLVAGEIAHSVKGEQWTKSFIERVIHRPDDVIEILAYCLAVYGRPLPNSLKKGLGKALANFDDYQLAKYRKTSGALKLVDAVNLLHPPHTEALGKLVDGSLSPANTWETRMTQAGQQGGNDVHKTELKADVWIDLVKNRKIGYFALLRNLKNILEQAPQLVDDAVAMLTDERFIKKSLVMPFRYRTALDRIEEVQVPSAWKRMVSLSFAAEKQKVIRALNRAVEISLANVPVFDGRTLIALDCSGSMIGQPMKIGSLFASVLMKSNQADLMLFDESARYTSFNIDDTTLSLAKQIEKKAIWGGTDFHCIFDKANQAYDRVIILSDMQAWKGYWTPHAAVDRYVKKFGQRPKIYSFDLAGLGTLQFPEKDVYALAGFSDKTMETLRFLEEDKRALIKKIEAIDL
ncbi:MAG: TROVE domain-containing protein [Verrucomicrobiota bacterium]